MRVAAIDIGSNSIRLLVADVQTGERGQGSLKTIARAGESCRLGRGLESTGRVEPEIAERAAGLAVEFARRAQALGARRIVLGATAALRRAQNGPEVALLIEGRVRLPVRILTGEEEARLVYQAVIGGLGRGAAHSSCVVFDIGGGSTEVVSGVGASAGRWTSLPFGAVNLTERYLASNPISHEDSVRLQADVRTGIMHQCAYMPNQAPLLAGVGGTITVLALLDRGMTSYEPALIEGWAIERTRLDALIDRVVSSTFDARKSWPAMGIGRADILPAGALVVRQLLERFPSNGLVCSTQGLRYGLAQLAAREVEAEAEAAGA